MNTIDTKVVAGAPKMTETEAVATVSIVVDTREAALWECFSALTGDPKIRLERAQLDLGDVAIRTGDTDVLLFERKAFADMASSLKDGRFKEQKSRILSHWAPRRVTYLLEGATSLAQWSRNYAQSFHGLSANVLIGMVTNTMYRDGIHVVWTRDVADTAQWVWAMAQKTAANPARFGTSTGTDAAAPTAEAVPGLKRRKIDNVTPETCWRDQLSQIPGLSTKLAGIVAATYPSPRALMAALETAESPIELVSALPGLGKKKAAAICSFLGFI